MCLATAEAPCATCHGQAPNLNAYGGAVRASLLEQTATLDDAAFDAHLATVLVALETQDSDADGFTNADEITSGSYPGDAASLPLAPVCPDSVEGLSYQICQYDTRFAYVRTWIDFCGHRPSFEELSTFESLDETTRRQAIHEALDACLSSEFWRGRDGAVWQLAHRKIRPVAALNGILDADYDVDYAQFAWAHIDGHDVRDLLVAQYLVTVEEGPDGRTVYAQTNDLFGQPMQPQFRAGMLTTSWVLLFNTMFTAVPRTAAAQAYRSYLNLDIAQLEGLVPGAPAPVDYDGSGISAPACAGCHATLEPLTYPFTRYNGIQAPLFTFDPGRMDELAVALDKPLLASVPTKGQLLGQEVDGLLEWAEVAANSGEFFRAVTEDYWITLVGAPPAPDQAELFADYEATWQSLAADPGHSVNAMLHTLVDTEAYGAP